MTNVEYLLLTDNQFTGSIPTEIDLLTNAESLDLDFNQFTGSLPTEIGLLANVGYLLLVNDNVFTGSVATEIGLLTNGESLLGLSGNLLSGSFPIEIGLMAGIGHLFLSDNSFTAHRILFAALACRCLYIRNAKISHYSFARSNARVVSAGTGQCVGVVGVGAGMG